MSIPTQASWIKMKGDLRYLKGVPLAVLRFDYQTMLKSLVVWSDSDFAGCVKSSKSVSAGAIMFGTHMWKRRSTNQAVIALSSGEAEYYTLVKAGSVSLCVKAICNDLGIELTSPFEVISNASAAIGISNRIGSGKVRHIEVTQLWLQEKILKKVMVLRKGRRRTWLMHRPKVLTQSPFAKLARVSD